MFDYLPDSYEAIALSIQNQGRLIFAQEEHCVDDLEKILKEDVFYHYGVKQYKMFAFMDIIEGDEYILVVGIAKMGLFSVLIKTKPEVFDIDEWG